MNDEQRGEYDRSARQRKRWEADRHAWAIMRHATPSERVVLRIWLWLVGVR